MEIDRHTMTGWVVEAIENCGGTATILDVCKDVWENHGEEIEASGDMFYKWQYEIRWAGDILRKDGILKPATKSPKGKWELSDVNMG